MITDDTGCSSRKYRSWLLGVLSRRTRKGGEKERKEEGRVRLLVQATSGEKRLNFGHSTVRGARRLSLSISSNKSSLARSRLVLQFLEDRLYELRIVLHFTGGTDSKMFRLDAPSNGFDFI